MAAFEDNNPFASPSSPSSSRANSYAPFAAYSFSPTIAATSAGGPGGVVGHHTASPSSDSIPRPTTSSSDDQPQGGFRGTNSDYSEQLPPPALPESSDGASDGESCCRVDEILQRNPEVRIVITDAGKASDGGAHFITYTIDVGGQTLRRRYSEFASFRDALVHLFPTLIIPPIPEKHSMSDYAAAPRKATEDITIIDHRKRMLQSFLNRLAQHPILRRDHTVHRFLTGDASWNEVLHTPPISALPKNILKAPPVNPASAEGDQRYKGMLIPKQSGKLKVPDEEDRYFTEIDAAAKEYDLLIGSALEKITRRLIKRYADLSKDYESLGGAYNAFSLNESGGSLPLAIERVGQACDGTYLSLQELVAGLSAGFSEPLAESAQFAEILRGVVKYRRQKALQLELTRDTLASKSAQLNTLEKSEQEARRIEGALARIDGSQVLPRQPQGVGASVQSGPTQSMHSSYGGGSLYGGGVSSYGASSSGDFGSPPTGAVDPPSSPEAEREEDDVVTSSPTSPKAKPKKRLSGVGKVFGFGKLNYAMKGIIDVDPETTRRNNIGKTKETIQQLESSLQVLEVDVGIASEQIRKELERYQRVKESDLRKMMAGYARAMVEFGRKGLEQWEEAKGEIEKIR